MIATLMLSLTIKSENIFIMKYLCKLVIDILMSITFPEVLMLRNNVSSVADLCREQTWI